MATTRITATCVKEILDDHITKHKDVYDPMLKNHQVLLVGEKGDNGLVFSTKEIVNGFRTLKKIGIGVIVAIAADMILRLIG